RVEVANRSLKQRDEVAVVGRALLEVAPHATAERLGLADVDDAALLVLEEVAAGRRRQSVELLDDDSGEHGSSAPSTAGRTVPHAHPSPLFLEAFGSPAESAQLVHWTADGRAHPEDR